MTENSGTGPRRRLARADRRAQLLDVARAFIREHGTNELTLARLAERAGVAKPLVYDHFGNREGVLVELFREFDAHQHRMLTAALARAEPDPYAVAEVVAAAFIGCALAEGRELAEVIAALAGSPALDELRRNAEDAYIERCREALAPPAGNSVEMADFRAIVGAGDRLARAALAGEVDAERACATLTRVIVALALR